MSNILLAFLAALFLSGKLKAETSSGLNVILVMDVEKYKADNPGGLLQPLQYVNGVGFVLGDKNSGGKPVLEDFTTMPYSPTNHSRSSQISFVQNIEITYLDTNTSTGNQVFLVGGGIGQRFVSLLFQVPDAYFVATIKTTVYGKYV